jgi:hypothetical protein
MDPVGENRQGRVGRRPRPRRLIRLRYEDRKVAPVGHTPPPAPSIDELMVILRQAGMM